MVTPPWIVISEFLVAESGRVILYASFTVIFETSLPGHRLPVPPASFDQDDTHAPTAGQRGH